MAINTRSTAVEASMIPPKPRDRIELTDRDLRIVQDLGDMTRSQVDVVVAVTADGVDHDLRPCLSSIAMQSDMSGRLAVVVLIDRVGHEDHCMRGLAVNDLPLCLVSANCGSAARARNTALEFIENHFPACRWIARMDWDDSFSERGSLATAVALGEQSKASFVLGGNRVLDRDGRLIRDNPATIDLLDRATFLARLRGMADGTAVNELPSCNLLLAADRHFRYPDISSAEDHWLVAQLLMFYASNGAILTDPLFADYRLGGSSTHHAKDNGHYRRSRRDLNEACVIWDRVCSMPGRILGWGMEGIVRVDAGRIYKHFFSSALDEKHVTWLRDVLPRASAILPKADFAFDADARAWIASYEDEQAQPATHIEVDSVKRFLWECLDCGIVCPNMKPGNLRVRASGQLLFIDIGRSILPMDVSVFRDSTARLYSFAVLGNSDAELLRRPADHTRPPIWDRLPGYADFYREVVGGHLVTRFKPHTVAMEKPTVRRNDVTLLIKACAMDAEYAWEQVVHIVDQLTGPQEFAERILLIDPKPGPFPRAHYPGDLDKLRGVAQRLLASGILDRVLEAPRDPACVSKIHHRWFGLVCEDGDTPEDVPVAPQLWGFEQVKTRYVLQCDIDVLIGRREPHHDYLEDMIAACRQSGVVCVAFNIPHPVDSGWRDYAAPPGEYKPEVRCGLLDLERIQSLCPLSNTARGRHVQMTWYRSLHEAQRRLGLKTLRGGCSDTFYIHPMNDCKKDLDTLHRIRDLVAQGIVPDSQIGKWDLNADGELWQYPTRREGVVVLAKGRNTPKDRIDRFAAGLVMQDEQTFGVIVIDDASDNLRASQLRYALDWLGGRLTLVRNRTRQERMANNLLAIEQICTNPETLIVVVDLDDALVDPTALRCINELGRKGHDVVLAAPYRPDYPLKVYDPLFDRPRLTYGGDVWIHLRAFRKRLFDAIPREMLQLDGSWIDEQEDYAIMIPIVESADNPIYLPRYTYWHERTTRLGDEGRRLRDQMILRLLAMTPPPG
jgi:hypothetical protein